jgi:hypothetical protein
VISRYVARADLRRQVYDRVDEHLPPDLADMVCAYVGLYLDGRYEKQVPDGDRGDIFTFFTPVIIQDAAEDVFLCVKDFYRGLSVISSSGIAKNMVLENDTPLPTPDMANMYVECAAFDTFSNNLYVITQRLLRQNHEDRFQVQIVQVSLDSATKAHVFTFQATVGLKFDRYIDSIENVFSDHKNKILWIHVSHGGYSHGVYGFRLPCSSLVYASNQPSSPLQDALLGLDAIFFDDIDSTLFIARTVDSKLHIHPFIVQDDGLLHAQPVVKTGYTSCSSGSSRSCPFVVANGMVYVYDESGRYSESCIIALPIESSDDAMTVQLKEDKKQGKGTPSACSQKEYQTKIKLCDECASKRKRGTQTPLWMLPTSSTIKQLQMDVRTRTLFTLEHSTTRIQYIS